MRVVVCVLMTHQRSTEHERSHGTKAWHAATRTHGSRAHAGLLGLLVLAGRGRALEARDRTAEDLAQGEEVEARDGGDDAVATVTEAVADAWRFCTHTLVLRTAAAPQAHTHASYACTT
jgi:hypothetical protein